MKHITHYITGILVGFAFLVSAQPETCLSHQIMNQPPWLPNTTMARQAHQFMLNIRQASPYVNGSPRTALFSYNGPMSQHVNLGAWMLADESASLQNYRGGFNYMAMFGSKKLQVNSMLHMTMGQRRLAASVWSNPLNDLNDPNLVDRNLGGVQLEAGAALSVIWQQQLMVKLRFPTLFQRDLGQMGTNADHNPTGSYQFLVSMQRRMRNGSSFNLSTQYTQLQNQPNRFDIMARRGFLKDRIEVGAFVSPGKAGAAGMLGAFTFGAYRLAYSFDIPFGPIQQYQVGSHEISLFWTLPARHKQFDRSIPYRQ